MSRTADARRSALDRGQYREAAGAGGSLDMYRHRPNPHIMPEIGALIGATGLGCKTSHRGHRNARNCHTADPSRSTRCVGTARSTYAYSSGGHSNCALAPLRPDHGRMYTCGFCSLRRQDGFWDGSGLCSADYVRNAATETGHEGLAANRPAGRGGMQEAESEFWKGELNHNRPHSKHRDRRAHRGVRFWG